MCVKRDATVDGGTALAMSCGVDHTRYRTFVCAPCEERCTAGNFWAPFPDYIGVVDSKYYCRNSII